MEENIIQVENLHKQYGNFRVLRGITTQVKRGEVVAIIGPSGCGKSTFLRSLNLLERPTSGSILFDGKDITAQSVDINEVRQRIGMVQSLPPSHHPPQHHAGSRGTGQDEPRGGFGAGGGVVEAHRLGRQG